MYCASTQLIEILTLFTLNVHLKECLVGVLPPPMHGDVIYGQRSGFTLVYIGVPVPLIEVRVTHCQSTEQKPWRGLSLWLLEARTLS